MKTLRPTSAVLAAVFLISVTPAVPGYELTGQTWRIGSTVIMQLELGPTNVSLIDGLGTWNNSAADALTLWNQHLERMTFGSVLDSTTSKAALDGYNSVFFSDTIFGEGFGPDTLAATVVWWDSSDYTTAIEADVVFNIAQSFNSYRGALLPGKSDFHRVALHEFGHVLGLAHAYDNPTGQALMEPAISNLDHLAADDIAGAVFLYGYRITTQSKLSGYVVGQQTTFTFSANNNPASFSAIGLPPGLALNTLTGYVTGIPLEAGTFLVTVTAHGWPRDVSAVITIEIAAASITSRDPEPIPIGTFFTYTITAPNNPTSFTVTGLPEGIVYNGKTGVISGIPDLSGGFDATVVAHGTQYDAAGIIHFSVTPGSRQPIAQLFPSQNTIRAILDPVRNSLYVLNDRSLSVVNTDSLTITTPIDLGFATASDFCLSPDNSKLWISGDGIHAYSLTDFSALPDIPNGPFYFEKIRAGAKNKLYVTNPGGGTEGLYEIDATTGIVTPVRWAMPGSGLTTLIETSKDGNYLLATFSDLPLSVNRYAISSGTPVLLRSLVIPSISYLTELNLSPDSTRVSYKTTSAYTGTELIYSISSTLTGPTTRLDPMTATPPSGFTFGDPSTTGYFNTSVGDIQAQSWIDFVSTETGLPFNKWEVYQGGPAFADHVGKNLFVVTERTVDVYQLAPASAGVEPAPKSLLNVSTRSVVGMDDQRLIGGFIISGDADKQIAFRAIGPSLPIISPMKDPKITIYDSDGLIIAGNHNWNQFRQAFLNVGLEPWDEHDAGLIVTLPPGSYTAVVEQETGSVGGVGLVELYDLSSDNPGKIANLSTRSKVGTGQNVMIGGFIVGGAQVTRILARAIGPSLATTVNGVLLDPMLELYNSSGVQIASNDDWRSNQEAEKIATGIPPTDNRESAILISVQPGAYTAIVRGKNDTTGVALVEIYNLDAIAAAR